MSGKAKDYLATARWVGRGVLNGARHSLLQDDIYRHPIRRDDSLHEAFGYSAPTVPHPGAGLRGVVH